MILADTSVWVDYFRNPFAEMRNLLARTAISTHPFIVAELALGSLRDRQRTLFALDRLPQVTVAHLSEVRHMIEKHNLHNSGIGLTDVHLIASTLITPATQLWTRDKRLDQVAEALKIQAAPASLGAK